MELTNEFTVGVPLARAWAVLTDVERIAPCLPGAQLEEVDGDQYRGVVKVKVGPITAQYKGVATFIERDEAAGRVVLKAEGRDTRGQGNATASVTATLVAAGASTRVTVATDLTITGKVAQFGRGILADVSAKMIDQFVHNLERDVLAAPAPAPSAAPPASAGTGATPAPSPGAAAPSSNGAAAKSASPKPVASGPRRIDSLPAEPVDLLGTAGSPVAKRAIPVVAIIATVLLLLRRRRQRRNV